jgi:hypothetical protein
VKSVLHGLGQQGVQGLAHVFASGLTRVQWNWFCSCHDTQYTHVQRARSSTNFRPPLLWENDRRKPSRGNDFGATKMTQNHHFSRTSKKIFFDHFETHANSESACRWSAVERLKPLNRGLLHICESDVCRRSRPIQTVARDAPQVTTGWHQNGIRCLCETSTATDPYSVGV